MLSLDILSLHNTPALRQSRTSAICQALRNASEQMAHGNFEAIHTDDAARMFHLYDQQLFHGQFHESALEKTGVALRFRLSATATRAGGKTTLRRRNRARGAQVKYFEIAIASRLLFMTFGDVDRPVKVSGLICRDRLEAMQRIMEHEIIHLCELLVWDASSCRRTRFQTLARNIFGHTAFHHELVTPHEDAAVRFAINPGALGSIMMTLRSMRADSYLQVGPNSAPITTRGGTRRGSITETAIGHRLPCPA